MLVALLHGLNRKEHKDRYIHLMKLRQSYSMALSSYLGALHESNRCYAPFHPCDPYLSAI